MATTTANRSPLIVQPHLYMGDVTGRPLDYGMVYFGEPNKDPEFYPINIYYDKDLTEQATQPVRTKGGFLNANGDIVEIFALEGTYSVKVLDQYGRKIFYKGDVTKRTIIDVAADITDQAKVDIAKKLEDLQSAINAAAGAGAGANGWDDTLVALPFGRNQRQKNFDVVSVKDYGAKGDGVTDDATAINNAFKSGAGIIVFPACKEYLIKSSIYPKSNTIILSAGSTIKYFNQTANFTIADAHNVVVQGIKVDGNQTAWTSWRGCGINLFRSSYITIRDCEIFNTANSGINVGQTENHDEYLNNNILIDNCYIHDIGSPSITAFNAYGNGIAVVRGKDVVIRNNRIDKVWDIGGINLEGLLQENVQIIGNRITNMTGNAPAIKLYAGGIDDHADNVTINDNIISGVYGNNGAKPAIFIRSGGKAITINNNRIFDSLSDGIYVAAAEDITIKDNKILNCPNATYTVNTATKAIVFKDNYIHYPDGAADKPVWIETSGAITSVAQIEGNTFENSPGAALTVVFRTPSVIKGNTFVNCHKDTANKGYVVTYAVKSLSKSIVGNNTIKDDIGGYSSRLISFYNFSGNHSDMVYLSDAWHVLDGFTKYDLNANKAYIETKEALFSAPPSTDYNTVGRVVYNADPIHITFVGWVCVASGTPGQWVGFGQIGVTRQTQAEIASVSSYANTVGKYDGRTVLNITNGKVYHATGTEVTAVWRAFDGTASITPV